MTEWRNWSGSVVCRPREIARPGNEGELAELLARAPAGRTIRVAGAGHSFSPLVATDGIVVDLGALAGIETCQPEAPRAWVRAGTRLHDLSAALQRRGLALENLGDVDVQTLGGALATATHGTGRRLGNLASRVSALRLLLASGEVAQCSAESDPELWRAARVSLGALGVVLAARLELLSAYRLRERVWRAPLTEILEKLDSLVLAHRHFEFFYFPRHDFAEAKAIDLEDAEAGVPGEGERVGWSGEILPSLREERFFEMEYSVPARHGLACFRRVAERVRARHPEVAWPLEYRTVAADDATLSMAHGRETVAISVHQDGRLPFADFFADVEPLFHEHAGRPHWGKVHSLKARQLAALYPGFQGFARVRGRVDPSGRFSNDHLRRVLGE